MLRPVPFVTIDTTRTRSVAGRAYAFGHRAFSLVELVVVIAILAVLATIAVPKLLKRSRESQIAATVRDLQMAYDTLQRYHIEHGSWPADTHHKNFPPELKGYFNEKFFTEKNGAGGWYDWNKGYGARAAIALWMEPADLEFFRAIDRRLDDGNLNTGNVRKQDSKTLNYIIMP